MDSIRNNFKTKVTCCSKFQSEKEIVNRKLNGKYKMRALEEKKEQGTNSLSHPLKPAG